MEQQIFEALVYAIARQTEREFYAMPQFKVGDRVKIVGPSISGRKTDVGKMTVIASGPDRDGDCLLDNDGFFNESSLELAPRFKVGDEVRVKAGEHSGWMDSVCRKAKYIVSDAGKLKDDVQRWMELNDVGFHWRSDWLEPWNPAEEWNGSAWVKKRGEVAKPAMIAKRGSSQRDELCESTNEAFKRAEALAGLFPGTEYVVYQEKGSRRVEKKSKAEQIAEVAALPASIEVHDGTKVDVTSRVVSVIQDEVTVIYKIKS